MFDWFFSLIGREPDPTQTTWAFCPCCHTEMVSAPDVPCEIDDSGLVHYICPCGMQSWWDFSAPVPLCVEKMLDCGS
jgi:hypothetical protein